MYTHTTVHRQICSRFWSGISGAARPSKSNLRDPSSKNAWLQPLRFVYSRAAAVAGPFGRDVIVVVGFTVLARTQGRTVPRSGGRGPAMWGGHQSTWAFEYTYPSLLESLSTRPIFYIFLYFSSFFKKKTQRLDLYDSMSFLNLLIGTITHGTEVTRLGAIYYGAEVPVAQASECGRGLGVELGSPIIWPFF